MIKHPITNNSVEEEPQNCINYCIFVVTLKSTSLQNLQHSKMVKAKTTEL